MNLTPPQIFVMIAAVMLFLAIVWALSEKPPAGYEPRKGPKHAKPPTGASGVKLTPAGRTLNIVTNVTLPTTIKMTSVQGVLKHGPDGPLDEFPDPLEDSLGCPIDPSTSEASYLQLVSDRDARVIDNVSVGGRLNPDGTLELTHVAITSPGYVAPHHPLPPPREEYVDTQVAAPAPVHHEPAPVHHEAPAHSTHWDSSPAPDTSSSNDYGGGHGGHDGGSGGGW